MHDRGSPEILNVLQLLLGYTELARQRLPPGQDARGPVGPALARLHTNGWHLTQLVRPHAACLARLPPMIEVPILVLLLNTDAQLVHEALCRDGQADAGLRRHMDQVRRAALRLRALLPTWLPPR